MKKLSFFFISVFLLGSCSSTGDSREYFICKNSAYLTSVEGRGAIIRTSFCDVFVENIRAHEWNLLREFDFFRGKGKDYPLESAFHVIVNNVRDRPIVIDGVALSWEGGEERARFFETVKSESFFVGRYNINLKSLWKPRRLLCDDTLLRNIDFYDDAIEYHLKFIAPGDRISFFYLFDYVPPQVNEFKFSITMKYNDFKKVIDFDMKRFDYRDSWESLESLY